MRRHTSWSLPGVIALSVAACAGNARSPLSADAPQLRLSQLAFAFPELQWPNGEINFPPAAPMKSKTGGPPARPNPCAVNDNMPVGGIGSDTTIARMPVGGFPGWLNAVRMPNPCFVEEPVR
jgi:hypothetical protein